MRSVSDMAFKLSRKMYDDTPSPCPFVLDLYSSWICIGIMLVVSVVGDQGSTAAFSKRFRSHEL